MKGIGFMGGNSIFETGTGQEMIDFFDCLSGVNIPDLDKGLIDGLYKNISDIKIWIVLKI